jgi:hypothetical protein
MSKTKSEDKNLLLDILLLSCVLFNSVFSDSAVTLPFRDLGRYDWFSGWALTNLPPTYPLEGEMEAREIRDGPCASNVRLQEMHWLDPFVLHISLGPCCLFVNVLQDPLAGGEDRHARLQRVPDCI